MKKWFRKTFFSAKEQYFVHLGKVLAGSKVAVCENFIPLFWDMMHPCGRFGTPDAAGSFLWHAQA